MFSKEETRFFNRRLWSVLLGIWLAGMSFGMLLAFQGNLLNLESFWEPTLYFGGFGFLFAAGASLLFFIPLRWLSRKLSLKPWLESAILGALSGASSSWYSGLLPVGYYLLAAVMGAAGAVIACFLVSKRY